MAQNTKKIIFYILIIVSSITFSLCYLSKSTNNTITIFQTTDIHAHITNSDSGMINLAHLLKNEVIANGGQYNCLLVDCGDLFQGTFEGAKTKGEITIPIFNNMHYDAFIPGNHDFDFGKKVFIENIEKLNCNILAGNLNIKNNSTDIYPWRSYIKNSKKIIIIGMTNPNLKYWLWGNRYKNITISSIEKSLKKIIPEVLASKPDLIILAVHQGLYQSKRYPNESDLKRIAKLYPQIDIILGGHSHTMYCGKIIGSNTVYIQAGHYGKYLAKISVTFKKNKKYITSELLPVKNTKATNFPPPFHKRLKNLTLKRDKNIIYRNRETNPGKIIVNIMKRTANTDIALYSIEKSKILNAKMNMNSIYKLVPYEDNIAIIYLTKNQLNKVIQEQYNYQKKYGNYKNIFVAGAKINSQGKITLKKTNNNILYSVAVTSYDLAGGGNRHPLLRYYMLNKSVKKIDTGILLRNSVFKYFTSPVKQNSIHNK
jgi:2',3'-cyclic-nucleotide 2'-phosphodiesterase (5'-nucleotidase family)